MDLSSPITALPGIGPALAEKLYKLNIASVYQLLTHLPFRYEDRRAISTIARIQSGETISLIARIDSIKNQFTHRGKFIQDAVISDSSGSLSVVWFNQSFLAKTLKAGTTVALYGKIEDFAHKKTLVSPDYEVIDPNSPQSSLHTGRIIPIYPETAGISSKWLRSKIHQLLTSTQITSVIPSDITNPLSLLPWEKALHDIHFPTDLTSIETARRRLAFDELCLLQIISLKRRESWKKTRLSTPLAVDQEQVLSFIQKLPFILTSTQLSAIKDILTDMGKSQPMNRLLEGDVGSGKTVVAAIAAYVSHLNGHRTIIMAPTQILASQHYSTLQALFSPFGISVSLVTSANKPSGNLGSVVVGTHALFTQSKYDQVGLVVIDEQHRFGVIQRALATNFGASPHILTMTATPIPRTVALTVHGELDVSVLSTLPSGRLPVKTWVVSENKRSAAYSWIASQITQFGAQIFIVCPFIDPSESASTVKAATAEFEKLTQIFSGYKLALLHGKLKSKLKDQTIQDFRDRKYDILVTTPVVEVGIDIPTATIMLIEGGERFGLAQLHQLRGRVGRSHVQSYCLLFSEDQSERLKAMENYHSGLELAEIDFRLRGPGQIYGTLQHGQSDLSIAKFEDLDLLDLAKKTAETLSDQLDHYPVLRSLVSQGKIDAIQPN